MRIQSANLKTRSPHLERAVRRAAASLRRPGAAGAGGPHRELRSQAGSGAAARGRAHRLRPESLRPDRLGCGR
eukprot:scaffold59682_cov67-Phaeocystis_antarctica.AAC.1